MIFFAILLQTGLLSFLLFKQHEQLQTFLNSIASLLSSIPFPSVPIVPTLSFPNSIRFEPSCDCGHSMACAKTRQEKQHA